MSSEYMYIPTHIDYISLVEIISLYIQNIPYMLNSNALLLYN